MTLRDRGTMKWTSIFLPEHIASLRKLKTEIDHAYERKPSIDPEQWADFEAKIQYAYRTEYGLRDPLLAELDDGDGVRSNRNR
ncbi:YolD-like family protein [Bacillus sonorensis]|nr:YolD-like family protein [Bacillus sonorensis]